MSILLSPSDTALGEGKYESDEKNAGLLQRVVGKVPESYHIETTGLRLRSISESLFLIEEVCVSDVFMLIDGNGDGMDILQERL